MYKQLRDYPNFVLWGKKDFKGTDKYKVPINPNNGRFAKSTDASTWSDFATAKKNLEKFECEGIGFVFTDTPYVGIDFDHVKEADTTTLPKALVEMIEDFSTYTELSQSKTGIHIIGKAKDFSNDEYKNRCNITLTDSDGEEFSSEVEVYCTGRYFALTFDCISLQDGDDIKKYSLANDIQPQLTSFLDTHMKKHDTSVVFEEYKESTDISLSEQDVFNLISKSKDAQIMTSFFSGIWDKGKYNSQSEADYAYLTKLAFYSRKDPALMESIFRKSMMYRQEKEHTIAINIKNIMNNPSIKTFDPDYNAKLRRAELQCTTEAGNTYDMEEVLITADLYVQWYMDENKIEVNELGMYHYVGKLASRPTDSIIRNRVVLDYKHYCTQYEIKKGRLTDNHIERALEIVISTIQATKREKAVSNLNKDDATFCSDVNYRNEILPTLFKKITDVDTNIEWCQEALEHWLWCVKRKANNRQIEFPIMLAFAGKTGNGKTTLIQRIVKPLYQYVWSTDFSELSDTRTKMLLGEYLIGTMDELDRGDRKDTAAIKSAIAGLDLITTRGMHTQKGINTYNTISFIGSSNISIYDVIHDTTSMRRFFEIPSFTIGEFDYEYINSIDWVRIWKSIDENNEDGYLSADVRKWLLGSHITHGYKDSVGEFFADYELENTDAGETVDTAEITISELYESYRSYAESRGFRNVKDNSVFGKIIQKYGITAVKRDDGKVVRKRYMGKPSVLYSVPKAFLENLTIYTEDETNVFTPKSNIGDISSRITF